MADNLKLSRLCASECLRFMIGHAVNGGVFEQGLDQTNTTTTIIIIVGKGVRVGPGHVPRSLALNAGTPHIHSQIDNSLVGDSLFILSFSFCALTSAVKISADRHKRSMSDRQDGAAAVILADPWRGLGAGAWGNFRVRLAASWGSGICGDSLLIRW
ncbi:uncharacterized protein An14g02730 [Aspergillus niger]|uniref:Contig An14c0110, genomic contig n=2 Tax=Aspergillus niger TaxID=5061 RepID=A2R319_ASPNC|nr:uncharacterized protein An14g02730 [Aspergillus niger]CAK46521.1 unnamed protein product [Aspergillus niger]